MRRLFIQFLCIQILSIVWAIVLFKLLPDRVLAGFVAGAGFVFVGAYMIIKLRQYSNKTKMFSYWGAYVHLFIFTLPMILFRVLNTGVDFNQVRILLWTGTEFHRGSEIVFTILIAATLVDFFRFKNKVA